MYSHKIDHCLLYNASSKKRETACSLVVMFAVGARTVKNVLFRLIMISLEKCLNLTISGKQSNIKVEPW